MDRGRLQTLPVAYDVHKKEWFDTAASGIRHFPGEEEDNPVHWKEWPYTFNTMCYRCHVSQLKNNYDLATDSYNTTWAEPGINCETCHGPAEEHVKVCIGAPYGTVPEDLKITRGGRDFTAEQNNDACAPCHAKMTPISTDFMPGDRYFDHYTLVCLESRDFYPDGRDLGENYTFTTWRMSPCVKAGGLDCLHCHTSSGRYRFHEKGKENGACLPCHEERIKNVEAHTHHPPESEVNKCIDCHMPLTVFAAMNRSDHSMLPPTPSATMRFESPNACTLCHSDESPAWADQYVREWHKEDYQEPVIRRALLIDAARKEDWTQLDKMLDYITSTDRDEIFTTSLIRLLRACGDGRKWPVYRKALRDPSPLVRSSAAAALDGYRTPETQRALLAACGDDYRLVRIRAAAALAGLPPQSLNEKDREKFASTSFEFVTSILSRPDDYASHYNLGNYLLDYGDIPMAVKAYETAMRMEPRSVPILVNASMAYVRLGEGGKAEESLKKALKIDPNNAEANYNLGLLKAETNDLAAAEQCLRKALKADPKMAEAAHNLGILQANKNIDEAIYWCRKAYELQSNRPKYAYTLAYFLHQNNETDEAVQVLEAELVARTPYSSSYLLLGQIHENLKRIDEALRVYRQASENVRIPERERIHFLQKIRDLSSKEGG
jgi:tetratricopeptide (TPR) repeat protein